MMTPSTRPDINRERSRSSIDAGHTRLLDTGYDNNHNHTDDPPNGSRRGSNIKGRSLRDEIQQFADKKKQTILLDNELSETERRKNIRIQLEQDIQRRVQEAFDSQTPRNGHRNRRNGRTQSADNVAQQRTLEELERLNAHIDLTDKEQAHIRRQRCEILEARRRVNQLMAPPSTLYHSGRYGDETQENHSDIHGLFNTLGSSDHPHFLSSRISFFREPEFNFKLGYDAANLSYKSQEHYAKIAAKAASNFGSLSLSERHEFYYVFTKNGFQEALRSGKLPDGSELKPLGRGRFVDAYGIIRDKHGPFWPSDYGPLFPVPSHKRLMQTQHELLTYGLSRDRNIATADNQQTQYTGKWRGIQIIYDSERSPKDYIPSAVPDNICPSLVFESRFECGNLRQARRVGHYEYELVLKTDMYTKRHTQWYYFRVQNALPGITYKFKIVNLLKRDSLYNHGMQPLLYSEKTAKNQGIGWTRQGHHISYTRNSFNLQCSLLSREIPYYLLEWQMTFPHADDTCFLSHCYPYTYTDLKNDLDYFLNNPERAKVMQRDVLCETKIGNSCFLITVTNFEEEQQNPNRKSIVISARVHPGESNSSWMMYGLLEYLTSDDQSAKELRNTFVFKIVPMLNPDGVIVGNYRCSLMARDLNRNYRHPRKESFPTVYYLKNMMDRLSKHNSILIYCDLHGHSRKQNVFMYGCNIADRLTSDQTINHNHHQPLNKFTDGILKERLLPWIMSKKSPDKFHFNGCKFKIRRCKESTGRVVMFRQMGIDNSFTMEATFCGTTICKGEKRHFNINDLQDMGRVLGESMLEYHSIQHNTTKHSEVLVEMTKAITQQVLKTQGKIPADMPDFTTEEGKCRLKEYANQSSVQQNKSVTSFLELLSTPNKDAFLAGNNKNQETMEHLNNGEGNGPSRSALSKIEQMISVMSGSNLSGCAEILNQLHAEDALVESDSSDSDSESEPEMKYAEPKAKRKKRKGKKKKDLATVGTNTGSDTTSKKGQNTKNGRDDSGLPAINNTEDEILQRRKNTSMGRYVKAVQNHPSYVNKYEGRSNGGIPCFSEERSIERQAKRMSDIQKQVEEQYQRQRALYYFGDDNEDDYNGVYGDYTNPLMNTSSIVSSGLDKDQGIAASDLFTYQPITSNKLHPASKMVDNNSYSDSCDEDDNLNASNSSLKNKPVDLMPTASLITGVTSSMSQVSSVSHLTMNLHRHSSHNARMLPMSLIHSKGSELANCQNGHQSGQQTGLMVTSVKGAANQTVKPLLDETLGVTGRPSGVLRSQKRRHSVDIGGKQSPPLLNKEYTDVLTQRLKKHRQPSDISLTSSKSNSNPEIELNSKISTNFSSTSKSKDIIGEIKKKNKESVIKGCPKVNIEVTPLRVKNDDYQQTVKISADPPNSNRTGNTKGSNKTLNKDTTSTDYT